MEPKRTNLISPHKASVAIVVLNWNNWQDTLECVESIQNLSFQNYKLIICDNGSRDNSIEKLQNSTFAKSCGIAILDRNHEEIYRESGQKDSPDNPLLIIANKKNLGFAGGNNVGIQYAIEHIRGLEYIWVLNNDTTVEPNALSMLVDKLNCDDKIGSVQSLLINYRHRKLVDSAGIELRKRGGARDAAQGQPVDLITCDSQIIGCCAASALFRVSALRQVGVFDETFFAINEDVDLALRLFNAGFQAYCIPSSVVYHKRGISSGNRTGPIGFRALRNKLTLMAKWWPLWVIWPWFITWLGYLLVKVTQSSQITLKDWIYAVRDVWFALNQGSNSKIRWLIYRQWMH